MQTSYELIQATKGVISKKPDAFLKFMELTTSDMFFQVKFVVCDDAFVNQELTALYKYFKKNFFLLENPNGVAEWINGVATEQSDRWLLKNKRDQLDAEKKGTYTAIPDKDALGPGLEIESIEYTQVLVDFLCKLPEIHRSTALAFYYNDEDINAISEFMSVDKSVIKSRVTYIETTLNNQMKKYCRQKGLSTHKVDPGRIRIALCELSKMYKYPYSKELYDVITAK